jgi:Protein of unknown function (DUF4089)
MNDPDLVPYVRAVAAVMDLPLDDARTHRVALHLARTAAMARQLDACALQAHDEPAEVFCPAPFPPATPQGGAA